MRWLRFVVTGLALLAAAPRLSAQFQLRFDPEQNLWSIENSVAGAVFQLTPEGTFELRRLTNKTSGDVWTPPPGVRCSPIRIRLEDAVFDENTTYRLVRRSSGASTRRSYRHVIELADLGGIGRVLVVLEMYEKQPVLRYQVRFQNFRQQTVRLLAADMLAWSFDDRGKAFSSFHVNQWVRGGALGNFETITRTLNPNGAAVSLFTGAYGQHCTWLALRDEEDRGLFAGWEFDGRANASVRRLASTSRVDLSASIQELNRPLAPNATFQVPAAFLGV
ncbi:MAG TPA: hypothetical protein VKP68_04585, partial [Ramlibacter sp.]|nr:hypothetical protein [Ramlibacter sp.]